MPCEFGPVPNGFCASLDRGKARYDALELFPLLGGAAALAFRSITPMPNANTPTIATQPSAASKKCSTSRQLSIGSWST